jgi:hypothetical protein
LTIFLSEPERTGLSILAGQSLFDNMSDKNTTSKSNRATLTGAQLVGKLDALGVHFLQGGSDPDTTGEIDPVTLLAALAASDEARLRLALIPLLLQHPDFAAHASLAAQRLPTSAQVAFKCYYTAALLLQQKYLPRLETLVGQCDLLPDLFATELGVPALRNPETGLRDLAERQSVLSGKFINWLGTYEHAAQRLLTHLERRQSWKM